MAHFTRVRTFGSWAPNTTLLDTELEKFDAQLVAAINGDAGGSWTPTSEIVLTGTFGLRSIVLKGGDLGAGNAAFVASGTNINFQPGSVTNLNSDAVNFSGSGAVEFDTSVRFNSSVELNGVTTNNDVFDNSNGFGSFFTKGSKIAVTDLTTPVRNPVLSSTYLVKYGAIYGSSNIVNANLAQGIPTFNTTPISGQFMDVDLLLDTNVEHTSFVVRVKGGTGHAGVLPTNLPTLAVYSVDNTGVSTLLGSATPVPGGAAAYEAGFNTVVSTSTFIPNKNLRYVMRITNEFGGSAVTGLGLTGITANGNVVTFGRTWCPLGVTLWYNHLMGSLPNIVTKEDKTLASLNAKVEIQNRNIAQLVEAIRLTNNSVIALSSDLKTTNTNVAALTTATAKGFKDVVTAFEATNKRIEDESRKSRAVTRLWSSFGFGILTMGAKTILDRFEGFWNKIFG